MLPENVYSLQTDTATQEDLESGEAYTKMWVAPRLNFQQFEFTLAACKDVSVLLSAKVK